MTLDEAFEMKAGKGITATSIANKKGDSFSIPCYGGNGLRGYVEIGNQNGEAVLIGRQGALCGNVYYVSGRYYATEHAVVCVPKYKLNMRFAYHLLTLMDLNRYKTAGAQPGLSVNRLSRVEIPVPSLEEQRRIVDILDRFDALVNDISTGLPAEIEARRKQYAYYRDKLLAFEEKVA